MIETRGIFKFLFLLYEYSIARRPCPINSIWISMTGTVKNVYYTTILTNHNRLDRQHIGVEYKHQ
jgi:hypothetical protein